MRQHSSAFTTMPFGLSGAPATFQRMMDEVLRGTESFAGVYLDDIIVHSDTWDDHLRHLDEALKRLEDAGLTLKLKKCTFATEDCTYLGYRIGRGGVKPAGYYRRFVKDYAIIAELTRKNVPERVECNNKAELAFQKLKRMLISAPLMKNPDFNRTFILQTDASGVGVGAVLSQGEEEDQPIPYFSRKLLPREQAYSTVEKECLAIVLAVKHFKA